MTKHTKWLELQSLQRTQHHVMLNGGVDKQLQDKIQRLKDEIRLEALRAQDDLSELELANRKEIIKLMHRYKLVIHARDFVNWRPVKPQIGDIQGVAEGVTIVATDGLLGYFIDVNDQPLCGHIDWFTGKIVNLFSSASATGKPRTKKKPQTVEDKARELLAKLLKGSK